MILIEHEQNGTMSWWKTAIMFDAAIICLFCKEIGIMVLVSSRFVSSFEILVSIHLTQSVYFSAFLYFF